MKLWIPFPTVPPDGTPIVVVNARDDTYPFACGLYADEEERNEVANRGLGQTEIVASAGFPEPYIHLQDDRKSPLSEWTHWMELVPPPRFPRRRRSSLRRRR
jgi:hypothetical protein